MSFWQACISAPAFLVNMTSVAAFQGAGSSIIYVASKAALGAVTKSLARAFGKENIRVNAVAPGFVDTHQTILVDRGMTALMPNT